MKLLRKLQRDESPPRPLLAIGPGVSYGNGGVRSWVEWRSRPGPPTAPPVTWRPRFPVGAEFHMKIMKIKWRAASGDDYRREEITPPGMTGRAASRSVWSSSGPGPDGRGTRPRSGRALGGDLTPCGDR